MHSEFFTILVTQEPKEKLGQELREEWKERMRKETQQELELDYKTKLASVLGGSA